MCQAVVSFVALIATLTVVVAMVVAAPRLNEATDVQKSSRGHESEERGQSHPDIDVTLGSSDSDSSRSSTTVAANSNDDPVITADGYSECIVSNGSTGEGATGHQVSGVETSVGGDALATGGNVTVVGGNAKAVCNAVGGDAVLIISSSDASSFIHSSPGGDFWAFLRTLLFQFSDDTAAGRAAGGVAAVELCSLTGLLGGRGSRVAGGSAVVFADHGGRAVGGSATVLGLIDGRLQVLCHAAGQISNVSGRVASGGVVILN